MPGILYVIHKQNDVNYVAVMVQKMQVNALEEREKSQIQFVVVYMNNQYLYE